MDIVERLMQDRLLNPDYATRREAAAEITRLRELLRISPAMNEAMEALRPFAGHVGKSGEKVTLTIGKDTWTGTLTTDDFERARAVYLEMHSAKEG